MVTIRTLTDDDREAAVEVINDAARWYAEFLPPEEVPDPEMTPEQWSGEARRMIWFGAFEDERLVGVIGLEHVADVALLRHWYVDPACQRRGVGARLCEHLEQQVQGAGRIIAGTYAGNYKAQRALARAGYWPSPDPEAVLRAYYSIPEGRLGSSVTYERTLSRQ